LKAAAPARRERLVKELGFMAYPKLTGISVLGPSFSVVYTSKGRDGREYLLLQ
jgi:hypothetical protein